MPDLHIDMFLFLLKSGDGCADGHGPFGLQPGRYPVNKPTARYRVLFNTGVRSQARSALAAVSARCASGSGNDFGGIHLLVLQIKRQSCVIRRIAGLAGDIRQNFNPGFQLIAVFFRRGDVSYLSILCCCSAPGAGVNKIRRKMIPSQKFSTFWL